MKGHVDDTQNMWTVRTPHQKKGVPEYETKQNLMVKIQFWRSWEMWSNSFLTITPRLTLTRRGSTCYDSIYGANRLFGNCSDSK